MAALEPIPIRISNSQDVPNMHPRSRGVTRPSCAPTLSFKNRGRRESRVANAPAASRGNKKPHERSHCRFTGVTRLSLRNGVNAYSALSPVNGSFATVACASYRRLDSSVGKTGPHALAVRAGVARLATPPDVGVDEARALVLNTYLLLGEIALINAT